MVTTLADSGAGSLRECVNATGPRTCVFRVGGTIELASTLFPANKDFLTVAGQTAPGGGIQISGKTAAINMVRIASDHVIWRYTRIRKGKSPTPIAGIGVNLVVYEGATNVIVDHNSTGWNEDEGIGGAATSLSGQGPNNVTFSYNIVSEGLRGHSTAILIGSASPTLAARAVNIDVHHNLMMSNTNRNPKLNGHSMRVVNNLIYNNCLLMSQVGGGGSVDIIGNRYKKGPLYGTVCGTNANPFVHEINAVPGGPGPGLLGNPSIYLAGNVGWNQPDPAGDQWLLAKQSTDNGPEIDDIPTSWRRLSPQSDPTHPIVPTPVNSLESEVLATIGASRQLDCAGNWVNTRDARDTDYVAQYNAGTGVAVIPLSEDAVGGYPTIAAGSPCTDADMDGMPAVFEAANGFDDADPSDRNKDKDSDGYTNLEEFLNGPQPSGGHLCN